MSELKIVCASSVCDVQALPELYALLPSSFRVLATGQEMLLVEPLNGRRASVL